MNERELRSIGEQIEALRGEFRLGLQDLRKDFDSARCGIYARLDTLNGTVATDRERVGVLEGIAHDSGVRRSVWEGQWKMLSLGAGFGAAIVTAMHYGGIF